MVVETAQVLQRVVSAAKCLTGEQQTVIAMRSQGYGFDEIAVEMGRSEGAVKALQHRGRESLRTLLAVE